MLPHHLLSQLGRRWLAWGLPLGQQGCKSQWKQPLRQWKPLQKPLVQQVGVESRCCRWVACPVGRDPAPC